MKVTPKEVMNGKKERKCVDGTSLFDIGGSLVRIYSNGKIEEILEAKVEMTSRGIRLHNVKTKLIDGGLTDEETKNFGIKN